MIIFSSYLCLGFQWGLFPSAFPSKLLYAFIFYPVHATCPAHFILVFITRITFCEQYRSLSFSLWSFLHSPVTSSLLGTKIPLSTVRLSSSLSVADQVSHPYKTTWNIRVLSISRTHNTLYRMVATFLARLCELLQSAENSGRLGLLSRLTRSHNSLLYHTEHQNTMQH